MTDTIAEPEAELESEPEPEHEIAAEPNADDLPTRNTAAEDGGPVRQYLAWAALAVLSMLAVVALVQFYSSVGAAIDLWIASEYQPIMRAAFNLAVLLLAGGGISWLVRELS
ncbi:hypothetical protein OB955_13240 [Halobacteria archaeon AArc-m2/3/4]|uniref:DUF8060 domain-containing protein n=1 Tax=Natronoglomus mannanivorans TaxID=2979990 RepID=A0AAP3E124_9EURY|nr:hypothetical protein [Halobacteria archaeon AArc-xg1-1]MCU4973699.1 hypothetical protein [Halobacteria archaeon AArc-m2/3/4]